MVTIITQLAAVAMVTNTKIQNDRHLGISIFEILFNTKTFC